MSKKVKEAPETGLEAVNDKLTSTVEKVQQNKKIIMICTLVVIAVAVLVIAYFYFLRIPAIQSQNEKIGAADLQLALGNDSVATAQYMTIADDGSYDAGNRAALQAAILLYQQGKYEDALKYAEKYSVQEDVIGAGAQSLKGDCLVNLDRLDDAVKAYKDAVKTSDKNPAYTPFFLMKLARVYAAQGNHKDEAAAYETIVAEYPLYGQQHGVDVEKLWERAKLEAGK